MDKHCLLGALINHDGRFREASATRTYTTDVHRGTHLELKCRMMRTSVMAAADKEKKEEER